MGSVKKTETGSVLSFNTYLPKNLDETKISFTPSQEGNGTPSPENVREIVGKNGITVWQSGKNLCPELTDTDYWSINGWFDRTGTITPNNAYRMCDYQPVKPDTDYTLSCSRASWKAIGFYDADYEPIGYKSANAIEVSSKSPSNARYYRIYITSNSTINNIQLEIGTTATEYEAYAPVETSVSFPSVGKNLFDGEWRKGRYVDGVWTNTNTWRTSELIPVEPNTTYCVSVNEPRTIGKIYSNLFDKNGNHIGYDYGTSVTTTADTALMTICNTNNVVSAWTDIQLEKGSTATAYEPFDNTVYGGYVDLVNGEVVAEWKKVDMGDLNWSLYEKCWTCIPSDIKTHSKASSQVADLVCDIYEQGRVTTASQFRDTPEGQLVARNDYKGIGIKDSTYATAADFKTAVTGHYLAYKLAEPIHYPLSPRILTTLQGNNVMWSDGDSLTISYTDDVVNTYDFRRHISLDTPHKASASGAVASFGTDMVGKMKCKIHFLPQQEGSGTPSPDNVRNISGRSSVKLWQSGKNLFDKSNVVGGYINGDGDVTGSGTSWAHQYIYIKGINKLTISGSYSNTAARNVFFDADMNPINTGTAATTKVNRTLTVPSGAVWYGCSSYINPNASNRDIDTLQVEIGETATEYEPYTGNEITFTFPSTVGDNGVVYGGYLDAENGEVVEEKDTLVFDGSEAWYLYASNKYACVFALKPGRKPLNQNESCSHFKVDGQAYSPSANHVNSAIWGSNTGTVFIQVPPSFASDVTTFKQFLADEAQKGTPVTIVADALNPIHYSLTPQSIATLRGSNRIWSDGDSVEVEYYKHTDEPQEYIPAEVLGTGNIAIVTSDGYLIGEEQDFIKY